MFGLSVLSASPFASLILPTHPFVCPLRPSARFPFDNTVRPPNSCARSTYPLARLVRPFNALGIPIYKATWGALPPRPLEFPGGHCRAHLPPGSSCASDLTLGSNATHTPCIPGGLPPPNAPPRSGGQAGTSNGMLYLCFCVFDFVCAREETIVSLAKCHVECIKGHVWGPLGGRALNIFVLYYTILYYIYSTLLLYTVLYYSVLHFIMLC